MFVKDFKHLSPPFWNNSIATPRGCSCFPDFHKIHCTLQLFSIGAITTFIFNIRQIFHMLLPNFLSIIHTYFLHPTFIFKTTNPNIFPFPKPFLSPHSFSTFVKFSLCSFQIFFQSSTLTFSTPLSSLRQLTQTFFLSPNLFLTILNNSRPSWHKSTFSSAYWIFWSIAIYCTLLDLFLPHNISSYLPHSDCF